MTRFLRRSLFTALFAVLLCALFLPYGAAAQNDGEPVVETDPAIPTVNSPVTIFFNADQGNRGLEDFDGAVYAHTGVFTDQSPAEWKCVKTDWPNNRPDIRLEEVGENRYTLEIEDIRAYYNDNETGCTLSAAETIQTMNFVFRNADGTREGKTADGGDIIVELGDPNPGVKVSIEAPPVSALNPIIVDRDTTLNILAVADRVQTDLASFQLFVNGTEAASTANDTLRYALALGAPGRRDVRAEARGTDGSVARDSLSALRVAPTEAAPVPAGLQDGINYTSPTAATLVLQAPQKSFVHVIGDFTDWQVRAEYRMKRETNTATTGPDSARYWIEIDGLQPGTPYGFQYLVDGTLRIPDPYAAQVLSPNDSFIEPSTYPNLKPYPTGQTEQLVSVLETGQTPFNFSDFERPAQKDLVIYELLIRDFIENHDFATLRDTLAYLDRLGVNAIELMPVSEFDGNLSWGYNPSLHAAVDKYYGPPEDLKRFVEAAHRRGIAVILDVVYNHATGQSPLVRLFNQGTFGSPTAENPWYNPEARHPFNVFNDMNHESPFSQYWLDRMNRFWLEEYNVDGYRFDLSKGFTQGPDPDGHDDVGAWSDVDPERIALLQRMADRIWEVDDEAYIILEHLAVPEEERQLTEHGLSEGRPGMMVWHNLNREYSESAMGYINDEGFPEDLSGTYYENRGFTVPNMISYMESHDEQWLMYRMREFGNQSDEGYSTRDLTTALERQKLAGAFFFTVPGPRMLWQFGELGYGWGPNECLKPGDGSDGECAASTPGRTAPKPIRWDYCDPAQHPGRVRLYDAWAAMINLRQQHDVFTSTDTEVAMRVGEGEADRRIVLEHASMDAVVAGNFSIDTLGVAANFPTAGTWYDFFTGRAIEIEPDEQAAPIPMAPGEFHIYTSTPVDFPEAGLVPFAAAAPPPVPGNLQAMPDLDAGAIALSWTASAAADLTGYRVYRGATAGFDTTGARIATLDPETTTFTDAEAALDAAYYYRVVATDNDGMRSATDAVQAALVPQTVSVSAARTFGDGAERSDYRLIALPGQVDRGLAETFSGEAGTGWQAFWDTGADADFLLSYDGSDTFDFAPGRGFWAIGTSAWTVEDELATVPLQATEAGAGVQIDLHDGWNIVSNPLDIDVPWSRVEAANSDGSLQPLWRFDGSFDQDTLFASAKAGEAFYFNNQGGLDMLTIPYSTRPASGPSAKSAPALLSLTARRADVRAPSTVQMGMRDDAQPGVGAEDIIGPPASFEPISLRIYAESAGKPTRDQSLVRSLRPTSASGQVFNLTLRTELGTPVELSLEETPGVAADAVRLVNRATGATYNLRGSAVTITPEEETTDLAVLAGSEAFVEQEQDRLLPETVTLQPAYPNPFRQQVTLTYGLPEATDVTLEVYDILGRRVRVLVEGRQEAGTHQTQWDGRNSAGQPVASGLYIGRLTADGTSHTQKMTLVR